MDWRYFSLHRGLMCEFLILFIRLETEVIYYAEHLHETQNNITEDINRKNKPNLKLHGLSSVLKCAVLAKFVLQR